MKIEQFITNLFIYEILNKRYPYITEEQLELIKLKYGIEDNEEKTYEQLSKICNLSRQYIKNKENKILNKLRDSLKNRM